MRLESTYVHALCSPTRGALLSGRFAYTTGGNAEVITNGVPDQLPTNIRTVADLVKTKGWATAAFGKWDVGMTTWGCTPLCRGFDEHGGFYNADEEYFSHMVGPGLDLRHGFAPDRASNGTYSTDLFTTRAINWITAAVAGGAKNSFGYLAYQAIHGPQQAPAELVDAGFCAEAFAAHPVRRIACAQMRAVDAGVARVVAAYKALGIWEDTLVILSADNGGNTDTGGSNFPLRGQKATMFEGGVRAASFASGAGLEAVAGTVSHQFFSLVDWLPTIAFGIAGVDPAEAAKPKWAYQAAPPPLDGLDVWAALSTGAPSPRTSALLYLSPDGCYAGQTPVPCLVPGQGALRVGDYKIISGHVSQYMGKTNASASFCGANDGEAAGGLIPALPVPLDATPPCCPTGWVRPVGGPAPAVVPPPEEAGAGGACAETPCLIPPSSPLLAGGVWLFNVVEDPFETTNLAATMPALAAQLLAQLQAINATGVPQAHSAADPAANPSHFGGVWTPWRGNPTPSACDPNATVAPSDAVDSNFDGVTFPAAGRATFSGWAWSPAAADGGRAPLNVSFLVDGAAAGSQVASVPRPPSFPSKTGAPNVEHGFAFDAPAGVAAALAKGRHVVRALVTGPDGVVADAKRSPTCVTDGVPTQCAAAD